MKSEWYKSGVSASPGQVNCILVAPCTRFRAVNVLYGEPGFTGTELEIEGPGLAGGGSLWPREVEIEDCW